MSEHDPIRVGIAGLGRSGWDIHARLLEALADVYQVVAVVDADEKRRQEAVDRFDCQAYTEYDALLDQAIPETDPARRLRLLAQAEGILNREAPIIPVYTYTNTFLIREGISGIPLHPQALFVYHTIDVGARGD